MSSRWLITTVTALDRQLPTPPNPQPPLFRKMQHPSSCTATMDSPPIFTGRNLTNIMGGAIDSISTPPTFHDRCATTKPTPPTAAQAQPKANLAYSKIDANLQMAASSVPACMALLGLRPLAKAERRRAGDVQVHVHCGTSASTWGRMGSWSCRQCSQAS